MDRNLIRNVIGIGIAIFGFLILFLGDIKLHSQGDNLLFLTGIVFLSAFMMYWIINIYLMFQGELIFHGFFQLRLPETTTINIPISREIKDSRVLVYFLEGSSYYHGKIVLRKTDSTRNNYETTLLLHKFHNPRQKRAIPLILPIHCIGRVGEEIELTFQLDPTYPDKEEFYKGGEEIEIQVRELSRKT